LEEWQLVQATGRGSLLLTVFLPPTPPAGEREEGKGMLMLRYYIPPQLPLPLLTPVPASGANPA